MEYPENLRKVLSRLDKVTEIRLPTFPYEADTEVRSTRASIFDATDTRKAMSSPFNFIETQVTEEDNEQKQAPTPAKAASIRQRPQGSITPAKLIRSPHRQAVSSESKYLRRTIANRVSKTPPKARLRHNDSQIHFAPIDSSPLAFDDTNSQLLTDHQKETKERQTHDAAIFPKLGSSLQSNGHKRDPGLPRLNLGGSGQSRGPMESDDQTSPILPIIDENLEEFLGSSPTPRSSKKYPSNTLSDGGPPSSPLCVPSLAAVFPKQANQEASAIVVEDDLRVQGNGDLEAETLHQTRYLEEQRAAAIANDRNVVTSDHIEPARAVESQEKRGVPRKDENTDGYSGMQLFSEFDVFVDAPAEPSRGSPEGRADNHRSETAFVVPSSPEPPPSSRVEQESRLTGAPPHSKIHTQSSDAPAEDDDSTSRVTDSFLAQSSQYSNDDEEISAQLAADIERANSQLERTTSGSQPKHNTKKRKRGGSTSTPSTKRLRSSTRAQQYQVVVESRKPDDITEDDRILLDTRSANTSPVPSSPQAKPENKRKKHGARVTPGKPTPAPTENPHRNADQNKTAITTPKKPNKTQPAIPLPDDIPSPSPKKWTYQWFMDALNIFQGGLRQVSLRPDEERAVAGRLLDLVLESHEAGMRHPRR